MRPWEKWGLLMQVMELDALVGKGLGVSFLNVSLVVLFVVLHNRSHSFLVYLASLISSSIKL